MSLTVFEDTTAIVGRGAKVVTLIASEVVGPVEPTAVTIREYRVFAVKPVKVALSFKTPLSTEGMVGTLSSVYV